MLRITVYYAEIKTRVTFNRNFAFKKGSMFEVSVYLEFVSTVIVPGFSDTLPAQMSCWILWGGRLIVGETKIEHAMG